MSSDSYIVVGFSILPTILTLVGNAIFLVTLVRTSLLHTPSNVLLGALCVTDLLVGLLCQPMHIALLLNDPGPSNISLIKAYNFIFNFSCWNSFVCSLLITLDRYAAICFPYRYRELATCKKYVFITLCILTFVMIRSIFEAAFLKRTDLVFWSVQVGIQLLIITAVFISYAKIYKVVLSHQKRIVAMGASSVNQRSRISNRERSKTNTVTIILAAFIACYAPYVVYSVQWILFFCGKAKLSFKLALWANYFVLLNSCINPIIYCVRSREIRNAAARIFASRSNYGRDPANSTRNSGENRSRGATQSFGTSEL